MKFEDAVVKILKELDKHPEKFVSEAILKEIKIGKNHFGQILSYISHNQLANGRKAEPERELMANPAGKKFIAQKENEKRQEDFNKIVALNAAILALIGIYTFIKDLNLINQYNAWIGYIILFFIIACIAPIVTFILRYFRD